MPYVHEYEAQYETMEGRLYQFTTAIAANGERRRYVANSHTNHG